MADCPKMKCVKFVESYPTDPKFLTDHDFPALPPEGAIIKVLSAGMCHSDVHIWMRPIKKAFIGGHEIAGSVHAIGELASNPDALAIGDQVAVFPWLGCTKCKSCRLGNMSFCDQPAQNKKIIGLTMDGGYAEYVAVPQLDILIKVPDSFGIEAAGVLGCGVLTAYNAVQAAIPKIDPVLAFRDKCGILIVGAGGLGLNATKLMKALVISKYDNVEVLVADELENKLQLVKDAGCHNTIYLKKEYSEDEKVDRIKSAFHEGGPHIILDFVGTKQSFEMAYKARKFGGSMICIGLYGGEVQLNIETIVRGVVGIQGVYVGSLQQMKEVIDLAASGKLTPLPHTLVKLEDVPKLMHKLKDGEIAGRAIVTPHIN